MTIYFLRHGDTVRGGSDDASRPLSPRGEEQGRFAATTLLSMLVSIDHVVASPLTRAQQTASVVCTTMGIKQWTTSEHLVPESNPRHLLIELGTYDVNSLLLVGHEPQLRGFVSKLISDHSAVNFHLEKGSLGALAVSLPIESGRGKLLWLLSSHQMDLFFKKTNKNGEF